MSSFAFGPGGVTLMSGTFTVAPRVRLRSGRINSLVAENPRGAGRRYSGLLRSSDSHHRCAAHRTLALHRGLAVFQFHRDGAFDLPLLTALHAITLHHGAITAGARGDP